MGNFVYPAAVVDGVVKSASMLIHGAVDTIAAQAAEIKSLKDELVREKAAHANRVELDKVAATASKGTSPELADEFTSILVNHAIIQDSDREKYASACMADPDAMARFAIRAFRLAEAPASQGYGVKSASSGLSKAERELRKENELWNSI